MNQAVNVVIFTLVSLFATTVGSICGLGGGVIIKPVLDSLGIMGVTAISFLSSFTVLSMSVVSVVRNVKNKTATLKINVALPLAIGAALGGALGKTLFSYIKDAAGDENFVGLVQTAVMLVIIIGTVIYTVNAKRIKTREFKNPLICFTVGLLLGIVSSFLGIGCGPINIVVLGYLFSMKTKDAALNSIFIILFAQIASLVQTFATNTVPEFNPWFIVFMIIGGVAGGLIGSKINKKIAPETVTKLFLVLMILIILVNTYNLWRFASAM